MPRMLHSKNLIVAFVAFALAGCQSVPPASLARLARISPLEADPAAIRFAVTHPGAFSMRNGDVTISLSYEPRGDGPKVDHTFRAELDDLVPLPSELQLPADSSEVVTIVRLSEADALLMREAQRQITAHKAAGGDGKGSIAVGATGCRAAEIPDGPLLMTTWIRTDPNDTYFALARDMDIRALARKAGMDIGAMPACGIGARNKAMPT